MIEQEKHPVRQHDMLILNPGITHTEMSLPAQPMEYIVLGIEGLHFGMTREGHNKGFYIGNYQQYSTEIMGYLCTMIRESEAGKAGREQICQHLLSVLVLLASRAGGVLVEDPEEVKTAKTSLVPPECSRVKYHIDSYYTTNISLASLATIAGWNKFYLSHAFVKAYGLSPMNYLLQKRLTASKALLKEADFTITCISQMVGFSSPNYFTQAFKRSTGTTASRYRKLAQSNPNEP